MTWVNFNTKFQQGTYLADFYAAVGMGVVPNMSRVVSLGHATNLTTGTTYDCYENAATVPLYPFSTTGVQLQVVSTSVNDTAAGSGMRTVLISGLDTNYNPLTEIVTMNGTTPVLTVNTNWLRRNLFVGRTCGTPQTANAGDITLSDAGGAHITHIMRNASGVGNGFGSSSVYTVPAGFSAQVNAINFSMEGAPASLFGTAILANCNGGQASGSPWLMPLRRDINSSFPIQEPLSEGLLLPEKSDISMRLTNLGQAGTEVSGGFQILLINNTLLV